MLGPWQFPRIGEISRVPGFKSPLGHTCRLITVLEPSLYLEGLHVLTYPAILDTSRELIGFVAALLAAERRTACASSHSDPAAFTD